MTRGEAVNWLINIMADIGKAEHRELWHYEQALSEIRDMLQSEPERKKGTWTKVLDRHGINGESVWRCSSCSEMTICKGDFCPNCGARMED